MGRVVLTTGAGSGLGLAIAVEMARLGFESVGGVRSPARARALTEAAAAAGVRVRTVRLDVTDAEACARVVDRLRPYGLVNNAGIPATGAVEDLGDEEARRVLETMVVAPVRLARLAIPHMRRAGGGRIVNISSIYGLVTTPLSGWYQASKHAIEALSDALRAEIARDHIHVVLIEPGGFRTGIWERATSDMDAHEASRYDAAYRRAVAALHMAEPLLGDPGAVARAVGRAMTARSPASRELVGLDARSIALWNRILPGVAKDRVMRIVLAL